MKGLRLQLLISTFLIAGLAACSPNLVVKSADIDFIAQTVTVEVENLGNKNAGEHLTYIEINEVGVAAALTPQTQYSASISSIAKGSVWNSGPIPFSDFSQPRGLDLSTISSGNLVVRADAKNMVEESDESDNISDTNH